MSKKIHFKPEPEPEYHLIGIACTLKDFRLTFNLNKRLFLGLTKKDDLLTDAKTKGKTYAFSFYHFEEPENFLTFYLIGNKGADGILVQEFKQADYLLLINGPFPRESMDRFLKTIREIPSVQTSYKIEVNKYKKLEFFFTDIELHTISVKKEFRKPYNPEYINPKRRS